MKRGYAHFKVQRAVESGALPRLDGTVACVDCGRPARHYDHRDYDRPLDVAPVCVSCNQKRGPAVARDSTEPYILSVRLSANHVARLRALAMSQRRPMANLAASFILEGLDNLGMGPRA